METIIPSSKFGDEDHQHFDPMARDGITMRCCCGYALHKQDENTYKCDGGNHQYHINQGDITLDKFGGLQFKVPEDL